MPGPLLARARTVEHGEGVRARARGLMRPPAPQVGAAGPPLAPLVWGLAQVHDLVHGAVPRVWQLQRVVPLGPGRGDEPALVGPALRVARDEGAAHVEPDAAARGAKVPRGLEGHGLRNALDPHHLHPRARGCATARAGGAAHEGAEEAQSAEAVGLRAGDPGAPHGGQPSEEVDRLRGERSERRAPREARAGRALLADELAGEAQELHVRRVHAGV
mmetsp:Transcript_6162/g.21087  ORF Transcript_6162/g.21087 Transcript_6162/m.21087 type:complete len:217 (+) Transcript_6162:208-858(+)